ncbi:MAG: L,D-transpeptidase family protein [Gammaproteobacteria bacterium]
MLVYSTLVCSADEHHPSVAVVPDEPVANDAPQFYRQYFEWLEFTTPIGAIAGVFKSHRHPYLSAADFSAQQQELDALYQLSAGGLLWVNGQVLSERGVAALELLKNAADHGLNAADYDVDSLLAKQLKIGQNVSLERAALYDSALNIALLRYLSDLHTGRVNPAKLKFKFKAKEQPPDYAQLLFDAAQQGNVAKLADNVEPQLAMYRNLKQLLPRYRALALHNQIPAFGFGKKLSPGQNHPQVPQLREFLLAVGDLSEDQYSRLDPNATAYSAVLVEAIKKFQYRHGLKDDGVIGSRTVAMLNVPLHQRVRQIELAMERLRWLPELKNSPYVLVNIPAFRLWAFDAPNPEGQYALTMKVVVGEALDKQTPVFMADMRYLDFKPYWNVPYSIIKKEILPKLAHDAAYLSKHDMEVVTRFGNDVQAVALTGDSFGSLRSGSLRVRQRPGKKNALGAVKFVFPNENGVYMHDTPSQQYFARERRDFSHGCIRVAEPKNLAEFVLKFQQGWDADAIGKAMAAENKPRRVRLKDAIPVIIFYATAMTDSHGNALFFDDIYGHDNNLSVALLKKTPFPKRSNGAQRIAASVLNRACQTNTWNSRSDTQKCASNNPETIKKPAPADILSGYLPAAQQRPPLYQSPARLSNSN